MEKLPKLQMQILLPLKRYKYHSPTKVPVRNVASLTASFSEIFYVFGKKCKFLSDQYYFPVLNSLSLKRIPENVPRPFKLAF